MSDSGALAMGVVISEQLGWYHRQSQMESVRGFNDLEMDYQDLRVRFRDLVTQYERMDAHRAQLNAENVRLRQEKEALEAKLEQMQLELAGASGNVKMLRTIVRQYDPDFYIG